MSRRLPLHVAAALSLFVASSASAAITYSNQHATVTGTTATLHTDVTSTSSLSYPASFDFGTTNSYGTSVTASPGTIAAFYSGTVSSTAAITGLTCNTTYYYRIHITNASNDVDRTLTTGSCSAPVPTVSEWGMIFLGIAFAAFIVVSLKRQGQGQPPLAG